MFENDTAAVAADPGRLCKPCNGSIVFCRGIPWRSFFPWMQSCGSVCGAVAVVLENGFIDRGIGYAEYLNGGFNTAFSIPVLAVSRPTFALIEKVYNGHLANGTHQSITAVVDNSGGLTPWRLALEHPVWWICSTTIALASCCVAGMSFVALRALWISRGGWHWGVPQIVIVLEAIPATWRFIYWSVDPIWQRSLFPSQLHTPMRMWSLPFAGSSLLVLLFFWHESVRGSSLRFSWSIQSFKVPCIVLIIITFLLEIVADILWFTEVPVSWILNYVVPGYYVVLGVALGIFYVSTSARILVMLFRMKKKERGSGPLRQTSIRLVLMGLTHLFTVIAGLIMVHPDFVNWVPTIYIYVWISIHAFLNIRAVFTIAILHPKKAQPSSQVQSASPSLVHSSPQIP